MRARLSRRQVLAVGGASAAGLAAAGLAGAALRPEISGGDVCVQACAHDPQVAVHAVRNLARIGFGVVSVRWSQLGFGRTSSTSREQQTPRNLMGFKDGTANLKAEDDALREHLWVRAIIGRTKGEGAPLGQGAEFDEPDFGLAGADGEPVIPSTAHVRLAHPSENGGARLLRRGYNFVDGSDGLGRLDAGLFFMAYQRDPRRQFVPVQRRLAARDDLNEYIRHVSSGLFACPPGVRGPADFFGRALLV